MDINGTESADTYDQTPLGPGDWHNYFGKGGDDIIRMFNGTAIGGPGNDTVEHLKSNDSWRNLDVAYWDSPAGVLVNLAEGWAHDGYGTRDTLVGTFQGAHGNWHDDQFIGNTADNSFWPNGGKDTIDGAAGIDTVGLGWNQGDPPDLGNYTVVVSIDGRRATITSKTDVNLRHTLTDVEQLTYWDGASGHNFLLSDFIDPKAIAEQGLTGAANQRWNASAPVGTAVTVSYSFVSNPPASGEGSVGFRAFSASEKQVVRDMLAATSQIAGIGFQEVTESGANVGQIRFGVSQQVATKGVATMPDVNAANSTAGDVWMDVESMHTLTPGSEGFAALLHEIGHALGLRHPRNVDAGDLWLQQVRVQDDVPSLTVMSGTASSDGLFRADWGPLDIAALRYLYGGKAINASDTVYLLGTADAHAERSLIDDGGTDTLDAMASPVGVSIDLTPGHRSSLGLTATGIAGSDNLGLALGSLIENANGSNLDDVLLGNAMANRLNGRLGNDWIDGAAGVDTAVFSGTQAQYTVGTTYGQMVVVAKDGRSGFDTLVNIERLAFADVSVAMDTGVNQAAGEAALLVGAVLGKAAVSTSREVLGVAIGLLDQGVTPIELAGAIMRLPIWDGIAGGSSSKHIATHFLTTVNGTTPDAATVNAAVLTMDTQPQGTYLWQIASSAANQANVNLVGLASTGVLFV